VEAAIARRAAARQAKDFGRAAHNYFFQLAFYAVSHKYFFQPAL